MDIDELDAAGDGVGRIGKLVVRVPFTLPGERVEARVSQAPGPGAPATARLRAVLRASPHRINPRCRHFGPDASPGIGPCGGCTWQHIDYPEQLRLKAALVTRLVTAAVPGAPAARHTLPSRPGKTPWGYRRKVHFVFARGGRERSRSGALAMGHYVRGTRRVLPVRECPVHDPHGNELAFAFHQAFQRAGIQSADNAGALKSIAIRSTTHATELMTTLVISDDRDRRLKTATKAVLARAGETTSLHLNLHPTPNGLIFGRDTRTIAGSPRVREVVHGIAFLISPTSFFQTNIDAAETLVSLVLEALPSPSRVLDLYAGAGLFALPLAALGHTVIAVEENRQAVEDGRASQRLNRISDDRCSFVVSPVEQMLRSCEQADAVVLDPPREGCSAATIDRVFMRVRPRTAVYVSCNPEALARDLAMAAEHGYRTASLQPVDMFPHTAHVETVAVLRR